MLKVFLKSSVIFLVVKSIVSSFGAYLVDSLKFRQLKLSDDEEDCLELFKAQTKPRDCCNYPERIILPAHQEKCKKSCEKVEDPTGGCCFLNCNYFETGVSKNSDLNEKALLELYENYLNDNGAGKFDQWLPVVEKSIKMCSELSKSKAFMKNHRNFHNFPTFSSKVEQTLLLQHSRVRS